MYYSCGSLRVSHTTISYKCPRDQILYIEQYKNLKGVLLPMEEDRLKVTLHNELDLHVSQILLM